MINVEASKCGARKKLGLMMLAAGCLFLLLDIPNLMEGYILGVNFWAYIALLFIGVVTLLESKSIENRYKKYFEASREMSISEIATECGIPEKKVIKELGFIVADKKDKKAVKNCEKIKFLNK